MNADPHRDWKAMVEPTFEMARALGETLSLGKMDEIHLVSDHAQILGNQVSDGFVLMAQTPGGEITQIQQELGRILRAEGSL